MLQRIQACLSNVQQVEFRDLVFHPVSYASMRLPMELLVRPLAAGTHLHLQRSWFFQHQFLQPMVAVGSPKMLLEPSSLLQSTVPTIRPDHQLPLHYARADVLKCPRNLVAVLQL